MAVDQGRFLEAALQYAGYGWRVVPLHARMESGACSCRLGMACPERSRGKHPRLSRWQHEASSTEDTIVRWWEQWPEANVGVKLGPDSGIIDVEFDDDEGRQTADRLFKECFTPTYKSGRSVHRIFAWSSELPATTKKMLSGLEVRIGADEKGLQSVFPPSVHHSGVRYEWLPGLSPSEVDVEELSPHIVALLWNDDPSSFGDGPQRRSKDHWEKVLAGTSEGSRNANMASFIGKLLRQSYNVEDRDGLEIAFEAVRAVNERNKPPLDDVELKTIFTSLVKKEAARRLADESGEFLKEPLEDRIEAKPKASDNRGFRLVRVEADPPLFELHAPQFSQAPNGCILLTAEDLETPSKIRIQANVQAKYPLPRKFAKLWNAEGGLYERLIHSQETKAAPPEINRQVAIAGMLFERLQKARVLRDGQEVSRDGAPCKTQDGEFVFAFSKIWNDLYFGPDRVNRLEFSRLLSKIGAVRYRHTSLKVLGREAQEALRVFVEGEQAGLD